MEVIPKNCAHIILQQIIDEKDGVLSVAEQEKQIPFRIKRVYYIHSFLDKNAIRGFHAHKELEQAIFCINGSFKLNTNDGNNEQSFLLNNPNQGIYIGKELWHTMEQFSQDCIILVFASDFFDELDYIRDYQEFLDYLD